MVSGGGREPEVLSAAIPVEVDEVEAQVGSLLDAAVGGGGREPVRVPQLSQSGRAW